MPQLEVYCTVGDCHHWGDGNHCVAEKILITTDEIGRTYPEATDASSVQDLARQHGSTPAHNCTNTCCKTFTPRDGAPAGGPNKMTAKARDLAAKR